MLSVFMFRRRGVGRSSFIAGKSVHNQRIERLNRDIGHTVIKMYRETFASLERANLLDVSDINHLWCLHYVYLPIINAHLQSFARAWDAHPMRTEGGKSPEQLFQLGYAAGVQQTNLVVPHGPEEVQEDQFGVDCDGPTTPREESVADYTPVTLPRYQCPLTQVDMQILQRDLPRPSEITDGILLYQQVLHFVCSRINL